jgi:agmatine deiminase
VACFGDDLEAARDAVEQMVRALTPSERVHLLVRDRAELEKLRARLGELDARLHSVPAHEVWLRDTGPTFVLTAGGVAALDFRFDGWGGRFPEAAGDDAVAARIAELAGVPLERSETAIEGGAIDGDGRGTLLASRPCLLDPARSPDADRAALERVLAELLGAQCIVWLEARIVGDDTGGHVDQVARFVAPGRVVCAVEPNPRDANADLLEACLSRLRAARDASGRLLDVIELPMPPPIERDGRRLPASYANFYLANRAVLVPSFGVPSDARALEILQRLFPERAAVAIPSRALLRDGGSCHCLAREQPA